MKAIERIQGKLASSNLVGAIRTTGDAFRAGDRTALTALDMPASTWIGGLDAEAETVDYVRAFMASMGGSPLEHCSVLPLLWDMAELGYGPADAFVDVGELFTDGTRDLIDPMAAGVDVRLGTVVTRVVRDDRGVTMTLDDGTLVRSETAVIALPLNVWADVEFDPPLAAPKRRAADRRHPGQVSKVLAIVHDAPETYVGMGWNTPINAGFVLRPAGDGRLFMGFSVQERVDLADHDEVMAAVNAHLPDATVITTDGHDWVNDRFRREPGSRSRRRGSATARSTPWRCPKAGSRSPVRTSLLRAPGGSKGLWAAAAYLKGIRPFVERNASAPWIIHETQTPSTGGPSRGHGQVPS